MDRISYYPYKIDIESIAPTKEFSMRKYMVWIRYKPSKKRGGLGVRIDVSAARDYEIFSVNSKMKM